MDEATFQTKLGELMSEISTLPPSDRVPLEALAKETQDRQTQLRKSINSLQEILESAKNCVSDFKAICRENQYLRQMLASNSEVSAHKGINPFTKQEQMFKAKPARRVIKVRPLKALKDMAK